MQRNGAFSTLVNTSIYSIQFHISLVVVTATWLRAERSTGTSDGTTLEAKSRPSSGTLAAWPRMSDRVEVHRRVVTGPSGDWYTVCEEGG